MTAIMLLIPVLIGIAFGFKHYYGYDKKREKELVMLEKYREEGQIGVPTDVPVVPNSKRIWSSIFLGIGMTIVAFMIFPLLLFGACLFGAL